MPLVQQREEFLAAPSRVPPPGVKERAHDLLGRLIRRAPRAPRALLQTGRALPDIAIDPLVAGLPRDAVERAQLGDGHRVPKVIGDELRSLVHG